MIHHVSVGSNNLQVARRFYEPLMKLLGLRVLNSSERGIDFGASDIEFSIEVPVNGRAATAGNGVHIAFHASDRATVQRFHAIAIASGGTDDGAPGLRPEYDANYYGAFVLDPDGNKIEAVTFSAD